MGLSQVLMLVAGIAVVYAIWEYGTDIMIVASSIRRRYWSVDFSNLMSRLADECNSEPVLSGGSSGSGNVVLGQQNQLELDFNTENEPEREPFTLRQLPKNDLIVLLAVQRKEDGGYLYSANEITDFVGGAAAGVKATIAAVRGKKEVAPIAKNAHRPVNGW